MPAKPTAIFAKIYHDIYRIFCTVRVKIANTLMSSTLLAVDLSSSVISLSLTLIKIMFRLGYFSITVSQYLISLDQPSIVIFSISSLITSSLLPNFTSLTTKSVTRSHLACGELG